MLAIYFHLITCRFVGILFDEIYIKEDIVYDKHSSRLIGSVNLGDVDRQLSALERGNLQHAQVATRILTIMVRGFFYSLQFPFANNPTAGITSVVLHDILWEATEHLERSDFIVTFQTGNGCSPNRRYYKIHCDPSSSVPYKAINMYNTDGRTLFFFSDAPHLMKMSRNCLSHSGGYGRRLFWVSTHTDYYNNC